MVGVAEWYYHIWGVFVVDRAEYIFWVGIVLSFHSHFGFSFYFLFFIFSLRWRNVIFDTL